MQRISKDQLNEQQAGALKSLVEWWDPDAPFLDDFILQGYAGTGKTTLFLTALQELDLMDKAVIVTPTNKAARVVTYNTGIPAQTIHSLLYRPKNDEVNRLQKLLAEAIEEEQDDEIVDIENRLEALKDEQVQFVRKESAEDVPPLVSVDEGSMLGEFEGNDLRQFSVALSLSGDPFQLAPVRQEPYWAGKNPDAHLTKIERTRGEGSGINLCAESVRLGNGPRDGEGMTIHGRGQLLYDAYAAADVVLVGTNNLRRKINSGVRQHLGFNDAIPRIGEKLVALNNLDGYGISNGETFTVTEVKNERSRKLYLALEDAYGNKIPHIPTWMPLYGNDEATHMVPAGVAKMTFGYAMTVHKSQGSQWENVIVCNDWRGSMHERWLYTGITRARSRCDLVF